MTHLKIASLRQPYLCVFIIHWILLRTASQNPVRRLYISFSLSGICICSCLHPRTGEICLFLI